MTPCADYDFCCPPGEFCGLDANGISTCYSSATPPKSPSNSPIPQPQPSSPIPQPQPSSPIPQPEPSPPDPQPQPSSAIPQPQPNSPVPQPGLSTSSPQPVQSSLVPSPQQGGNSFTPTPVQNSQTADLLTHSSLVTVTSNGHTSTLIVISSGSKTSTEPFSGTTTPEALAVTHSKSSWTSSKIGAVAGGTVGGLLAFGILIFLLVLLIKKIRDRESGDSSEKSSDITHQKHLSETTQGSNTNQTSMLPIPIPAALSRKAIYDGTPILDKPNAVRILTILRGGQGSDMRCGLKVVSMANYTNMKCAALSYCWEDDLSENNGEVSITTNGYEQKIKRNLSNFLHRIRRDTEDIVIWIDAICIDQKNESEKDAQVPKMRDIYGYAAITYIWLGERTDASDLAFGHFKRFQHIGVNSVNSQELLDDYAQNRQVWTSFGNDIAERRWFTRLWIVQEIIMSGNPYVMCGAKCLPWSVIPTIIRFAVDNRLDIFNNYSNRVNFRQNIALLESFRLQKMSNIQADISYWIQVFSNHDCFKPSDKVIALRGLASDRDAPGLRNISYRMTPTQVYTETTKHVLR
jgi:hypothetical protein